MKLKTLLGTSFQQNIEITLNLFDSLIKPILLYSSDFLRMLGTPKGQPHRKTGNYDIQTNIRRTEAGK